MGYLFHSAHLSITRVSNWRSLVLILAFASCAGNPTVSKKSAPAPAPLAPAKTARVISDPANTLDGKPRKLKLEFISIGCACASWLDVRDEEKLNSGHMDNLLFIEPANPRLQLPDKFDPENEDIIVRGEFYVKEDYPKGTAGGGEEHLEKARVFRYTSIRIVKK